MMGTRHLICIQQNNEYKVAQYGQWDGYPSGQGVDVLNFAKNLDKDLFICKLENVFSPTQEQIDGWYKDAGHDGGDWLTVTVASKFKESHPILSRDAGAGVLELILNSNHPLPLISSLNFAADSLFCEWAYVNDLDSNTFEVFKGFNQSPLNQAERFANIKSNDSTDGYYPVRLVKLWALSDLPDEEFFLDLLEPCED